MPRWRGKRNRKRKGKGGGKRGDSQALAHRGRLATVQLRPEPLEIIAGHDGLFRGRPEPVVVAAAYACTPEHARLVSRVLVPFAPDADAPTWAPPHKRPQPNPVRFEPSDAMIIVIVAIAMEEDAGGDIADLYGDTDRAEDLLVWPLDGNDAVPRPLAGIRDWVRAECSLQVGLHGPAGPPIDTFKADDYVGTAVAWFGEPTRRRTAELALPIRSRDRRNHWVVNLRIALR